MPIPLATVDVWDYGTTHWYGLLYEPPIITRSIGSGDAVTGFVEVSDIEWTMFPYESSGALGSLLRKWLRDEYQDHVVKAGFRDIITGQLSEEWVGVIQEDGITSSGGIHLKGAGFPATALQQRIPTPVITLEDFPGAVDLGKTPPYVIGIAKKMKLPYIDDRGPYDYMLMLGRNFGSFPSIFRDTLNQGATLPPGAQSFEAVPPATYSVVGELVTPSGYNYVRVRFTTRQVNESGSLVGIYADFEGDNLARTSPVEALRCVLTHNTDGLYGPTTGVDHASFDTARDQLASLIAPRTMSVDGIIGINNQPVAITDVLKPLLQMISGYLGLATTGKFTLSLDAPRSAITMVVGAGPLIADNNIREDAAGMRRRRALSDRPKRFILDYSPDGTTGAYLYQRIKSLGTKGRDIPAQNAFIRRHQTADMVADRLAKIERNSQDLIEGTVIASPQAWSLNEGHLILYTWQPHGCEEELRKVIRIRKELGGVTIDHRAYHPNEWTYTPSALPPDFDYPENNPPAPPGESVLLEDTGEARIVTDEIPVLGSYTQIKDVAVTLDAAGHDLKKWAFVEICTRADVAGGFAGTVWARLRNVTTGQSVEITKTLYARNDLFIPYTVYFASFPPSELRHDELGLGATGVIQIVLEIMTSPPQTLFYGSADTLTPGQPSQGYLRAQEWS